MGEEGGVGVKCQPSPPSQALVKLILKNLLHLGVKQSHTTL